MKRTTLLFSLLFLCFMGWSQSPDQIVGKLMNEQNMFELRIQQKKYEKDLMPMLNYFSQAMLSDAFNTPQKGIVAVDTLLNNQAYQQQLGLANISYLIYLKSQFYADLQDYAQSAEMLSSFNEQTKNLPIETNMRTALEMNCRIHTKLSKLNKTIITRPNKELSIAFQKKRAGRGSSINITGQLNGKETMFCFDTGNPLYSVVTSQYAKEYGIHTIIDSIAMKGVGNGYAQIGTAKELKLGDIKIENPLFYVVDRISPVDSIKIDAVLGSQILNQLGEVSLDLKNERISFPAKPGAKQVGDADLIMNSHHLFVKAKQNEDELLLHLDTGASNSNLSVAYFTAHQAEVEKMALKDSIRMAGFGGIHYQVSYTFPELGFQVGSNSFQLKDLAVYTQPLMDQWKAQGNLGADFFFQFDKVTLSYKEMFIRLE